MPVSRRDTLSWTNDVLPFVAMMMLTCIDMSVLTIVKAAMNDGISSIVYIVYHAILGTLILLPFYIIHIFRICLPQVVGFLGLSYSSPTMASALSNLDPANTFLIAVIFRMEKIKIRSSSSRAKLLGTLIAVSGAMVFTFYQGPIIFQTILSPDSSNYLRLSQPSAWVFGGFVILIAKLIVSLWNVLQTATAREYLDQQTIVFFCCLFGMLQCMALSPFLEPNPSAWVVQSGIGMTAILYGAVYSAIRNTALTWCLEKKGPVFVAMFAPVQIVFAVILGVTFLGDSLHLGSAIGATIVAAGFYTVMWGQVIEKNKLPVDLVASEENGSSNPNTPLLSSLNESNAIGATIVAAGFYTVMWGQIIYYEGARRVQGKLDDVAGNGKGVADIKVPQVDAQMDAEVGETLNGTPRKRERIARDVKVEGIFGTKARPEGMIGKIEIR
ncbi:eamA domain, WAT1-related protein [Artemisia annua]|uniref:EamA domain, WAT1-related protein n=1 Tax=Artemisia annua TaxID=35608 RepID=A0A2U1PVI1_ARTAN|nr:eamA domain, WAT1-related protein [Artemisia annua]